MHRAIIVLCAAAQFAGSPAAAQTAPQTPEQRAAAYEAHKGDFDYLLGDWEFTASNREFGTIRGYWSALRLSAGADSRRVSRRQRRRRDRVRYDHHPQLQRLCRSVGAAGDGP